MQPHLITIVAGSPLYEALKDKFDAQNQLYDLVKDLSQAKFTAGQENMRESLILIGNIIDEAIKKQKENENED